MVKKLLIVLSILVLAACGKSDSSVGGVAIKQYFLESDSIPSVVEAYDIKYKLVSCNEDNKVQSDKHKYYLALGEVEVFATALTNLPKFSVNAGDKIKMLYRVYVDFSTNSNGNYTFNRNSQVDAVGLGKI